MAVSQVKPYSQLIFSLSFLKCLSLDFFLILRCSFLTPVCSSLPSAFPQYIFINCCIFLGNWSFCDYVMSFVSCVSFSVYFVWYCVVTPAVYRIEYLFPSFHFLPFLSLDYSVALAVCFLPVTSSHGLCSGTLYNGERQEPWPTPFTPLELQRNAFRVSF